MIKTSISSNNQPITQSKGFNQRALSQTFNMDNVFIESLNQIKNKRSIFTFLI